MDIRRQLRDARLNTFAILAALAMVGIIAVLCFVMFGPRTSRFPLSSLTPKQTFSKEFNPVIALGAIPPVLTDVPAIPVAKARAEKALNPEELVLVVTLKGETCGYPITMLQGPLREIFNVTLGGQAIAATW